MTPTQLTEAESHPGSRAPAVRDPRGVRVEGSICLNNMCLGAEAPGGGHGPGRLAQTVPWPEGHGAGPPALRAASLGWIFPVLQDPPLFSHPPYSLGWAEGENRAGLQGMARNKTPPSPVEAHTTSPELATGQRNRHQCEGQALGPHREVFSRQSTA